MIAIGYQTLAGGSNTIKTMTSLVRRRAVHYRHVFGVVGKDPLAPNKSSADILDPKKRYLARPSRQKFCAVLQAYFPYQKLTQRAYLPSYVVVASLTATGDFPLGEKLVAPLIAVLYVDRTNERHKIGKHKEKIATRCSVMLCPYSLSNTECKNRRL